MRCCSLSKSMRTGFGGVFGRSSAAVASASAALRAGSAGAFAGFSSSLSGASGEANVIRQHDQIDAARHLVLVAGHIQPAG